VPGGALVVADQELYRQLYYVQNATVARLGAFESYLVARGLKTRELRVCEQCRTAQRLAEFLAGDPRVRRVLYPGLPNHPGHEIAARQMDGGFGAMLSFEIDVDFAQTN
jgi:cystathionine beta-lyase/cystathionine gamma-synthase